MKDDADNLAVLAQIAQAFNQRGFDEVLSFADEEFEFHEPPEQPGATVFRGHDEVREGFARWAETWADQKTELQRYEVLPDGRIFALTRERMLGRDGVRVENDCGHVFTFRDGKIVRWQVFWDLANARAVAGV